MSESVFFGQGQFSGQVFNSVNQEQTINHLIYNNFFGLPYTGSYGCDQSKSSLSWCARWLSVQAWMPLFVSRSSSQFQFSNHPEYYQQIHQEVVNRQSLNKWIFAQFLKNYDQKINAFSGTIIQPIWWFNTSDTKAYKYESREFIFGDVFLIAPILDDPENEYSCFDYIFIYMVFYFITQTQLQLDQLYQTEYDIYFPKGSYWMQTSQQAFFIGGTQVNFNILSSIKQFKIFIDFLVIQIQRNIYIELFLVLIFYDFKNFYLRIYGLIFIINFITKSLRQQILQFKKFQDKLQVY